MLASTGYGLICTTDHRVVLLLMSAPAVTATAARSDRASACCFIVDDDAKATGGLFNANRSDRLKKERVND